MGEGKGRRYVMGFSVVVASENPPDPFDLVESVVKTRYPSMKHFFQHGAEEFWAFGPKDTRYGPLYRIVSQSKELAWIIYESFKTLLGEKTPAGKIVFVGKEEFLNFAEFSPGKIYRIVLRFENFSLNENVLEFIKLQSRKFRRRFGVRGGGILRLRPLRMVNGEKRTLVLEGLCEGVGCLDLVFVSFEGVGEDEVRVVRKEELDWREG